jgi:hypothetical protein
VRRGLLHRLGAKGAAGTKRSFGALFDPAFASLQCPLQADERPTHEVSYAALNHVASHEAADSMITKKQAVDVHGLLPRCAAISTNNGAMLS